MIAEQSLNEMGAEQLLGSGDMLLLENGGMIKRLHGGFVSENEVERVVNYIKKQATFDPKKEISLSEFSEFKTIILILYQAITLMNFITKQLK